MYVRVVNKRINFEISKFEVMCRSYELAKIYVYIYMLCMVSDL